MSATIVVLPTDISSWPALAAAATAVAREQGFETLQGRRPREERRIVFNLELDMENMDAVGEGMKEGDEIVMRRDDLTLIVSTDEKRRCRACVMGEMAPEELKQQGEEMLGRIIQRYVHRRIEEELEAQGFVTLNEEKTEDNSIRLHVRRFEG